MRQIPLDIGPALVPTLQNFLPGPNVQLWDHLHQWLQAQAAGVGGRESAVGVYVAGAPGSGKSHLMGALAGALRARGQACGVLRPGTDADAAFDPAWSAVILEDVHAYDAARQHTAFNWFVNAQTEQRAVLATGVVLPHALPVREDLRTRCGGGHVFSLQPLTEAQVRAVLRANAQTRGLVLGDEVLDYVLLRFSRDLGSLMPLLAALDHYAMQTQRAITIPFVKNTLENL